MKGKRLPEFTDIWRLKVFPHRLTDRNGADHGGQYPFEREVQGRRIFAEEIYRRLFAEKDEAQ